MNTQVVEFLTANQNSNKGQIADGINLRGLGLFNLLKGMVKSGEIQVEGEGHDATYSVAIAETASAEQTETPMLEETVSEEHTGASLSAEPSNNGEVKDETGAELNEVVEKEQVITESKPAKKTVGRNNGTFKFQNVSYNKGKLIHAVVSAHCSANKNISHDKLKGVFADSLLKRFGIFQTVEKAREISGAKYDRYFFKEEMQIKLKDAVIVTSNQITGENILPFIEAATKLGYVIEAE